MSRPSIVGVSPGRLPVPPVKGGAVERIIHETAVGMPHLTVVSPWDPELSNGHVEGSMKWVDVSSETRALKDTVAEHLGVPSEGKELARFAYLNGAASIIDKMDPDIVEVHNRIGTLDFIQREFPDQKTVLHMYNEIGPSGETHKRALRQVDRVVFVSTYLRDRAVRMSPFLQSKARVVHNSLDPHQWRPRPVRSDGRHLLFVGRTTRAKGAHLALEAFAKVKDALEEARLTIVGTPFFGLRDSDSFHRGLERRAEEIGSVELTGFLDYASLRERYTKADLLLVPSLFEDPLPCVILEAMASGLPVLASRRGGIPEMIEHGSTGWLCDPRDLGAFADIIVDILGDYEGRAEIARRARTKIEVRFPRSKRIRDLNHSHSDIVS